MGKEPETYLGKDHSNFLDKKEQFWCYGGQGFTLFGEAIPRSPFDASSLYGGSLVLSAASSAVPVPNGESRYFHIKVLASFVAGGQSEGYVCENQGVSGFAICPQVDENTLVFQAVLATPRDIGMGRSFYPVF